MDSKKSMSGVITQNPITWVFGLGIVPDLALFLSLFLKPMSMSYMCAPHSGHGYLPILLNLPPTTTNSFSSNQVSIPPLCLLTLFLFCVFFGFNQGHPCGHGCGVIHWSSPAVGLLRSMYPPPRNYRLSIAPLGRAGPCWLIPHQWLNVYGISNLVKTTSQLQTSVAS